MTTTSRPEEVFIATMGTSPAVVTACLDLLLWEGRRFSSVIVVHTAPQNPAPELPSECYATCSAEEAIRLIDAEFDPAASEPFYRQFDQPIDFRRVPVTLDGQPVDDVNTLAEAKAAFFTLHRVVREQKDAGKRVHIGITGGSRTLGMFTMAVAQVVFDVDDRMWNVFPSPAFLHSGRLHPSPRRPEEASLMRVPVVPVSLFYLGPLTGRLMSGDPAEAVDAQWELIREPQRQQCQVFLDSVLTRKQRRVTVCFLREVLYHHASPTHADLARELLLEEKTVSAYLSEVYDKMREHFELYDQTVNATVLIALFAPHRSDLDLTEPPKQRSRRSTGKP